MRWTSLAVAATALAASGCVIHRHYALIDQSGYPVVEAVIRPSLGTLGMASALSAVAGGLAVWAAGRFRVCDWLRRASVGRRPAGEAGAPAAPPARAFESSGAERDA